MRKKVLFVGHNSGRSGAPLILLTLLRWLNENTDISFEVLLRAPGSLSQAFAAVAPTTNYEFRGGPESRFARLAGCFRFCEPSSARHYRLLLERVRSSDIGLIYSNTITNGDILEFLSPLGCPVITHVHELDSWINHAGEKNLQQVMRYSNSFIAASNAVKANLVDRYGFDQKKVHVVKSFIPTGAISADPAEVKMTLGIPENAFVVIGSGCEPWGKGKDLFAPLAAKVRSLVKDRPVHFLWVGGWRDQTDRRNILHDVEKLQLQGSVHFVGEVANPHDYFAAGDLFALVSREDSFPLACLEAAALGKPVICFADAGGMPEFVEEDAGFIVPYLDLAAMAEKISGLCSDASLCASLGCRARQKVVDSYDVATGAHEIAGLIKEFGR